METDKQLPLGFGMALAQNQEAMERFSQFSEEEKQQILEGTHRVHSRQEMQQYVERIKQSGQ